MEERHVQLSHVQFNRHYRQWEATGWAERYGVRLQWVAWRAHDCWEVAVPQGQYVADEEVLGDLVRLNPPLSHDVRCLLREFSRQSADYGP